MGKRVIRRHRRKIGSRWRKLSPGQQALLVLAYLRKGETFADLAAGLGIGTAPGSVKAGTSPTACLQNRLSSGLA
jgi:Helix-turn-helix of DDE superfamily endonuclease